MSVITGNHSGAALRIRMAQRWPEAAYDAQYSSVAVAVAEWVAVAVTAAVAMVALAVED